jgi:3-hydroxyisobutyrate dehydrogenase
MGERVGLVGIGLMGSAFSHHLRAAGFEVRGFDTNAERLEQFHSRGGIAVDSPAAAAEGARWVVTSLPNSDIVRDVVLGRDGIAQGARSGALIADTTTSRPQDSERLAQELETAGIGFLDAAVSGTSAMAWKKDLIVVAGGSPEQFDACKPLFDGFARAAYRMGPVGAGAMTKLIVNLVLFGNRLALAEGLVLGMKSGMEGESLLEVLKDAACSSKTMIDKGPKMLAGDYSPEGQVKISLKDARLALEQGMRVGSPMLLGALWTQLQQAGYEQGLGELDSVAFIEVLRQLAGLPKRA